ncbi:MAG: hypothetical protein QXO67_02480 [Candidatus Bathyarchaeia archaeon]
MLPEKAQAVLLALLKLKTASFRAVQKETKISPRILRRYLDYLHELKLISKNERGKRGLAHSYSLTQKGIKEATQTAFVLLNKNIEAVNKSLMLVSELSREIVKQPDKLEEWRRASGEAILNVRITEDMPLEERIRRILAEEKRTFGVLTEAYKNMHRLMCEVSLWKLKKLDPEHFDPAKIFIGFGKHSEICFVPAALLKEKDIL